MNQIDQLQRNTLDHDNMTAYAYRVKKYFVGADTALDIGCGTGYQTAHISKLMPDMHIDMLDKTGVETAVQYSEHGYLHNDLERTQQYVDINNLNASVYNVDDYTWDRPVDVVYSTLSWGWHYPIALYLKQVLQLKPRYIIIDQRQKKETIPGYRCIDQFQINRKELTRVYVTQELE